MPRRPAPAFALAALALAFLGVLSAGCPERAPEDRADAGAPTASQPTASSPAPALTPPLASVPPPEPPAIRCPSGMMLVDKTFCVDKWEASLVDKKTGQRLSPYYPPDRKLAIQLAESWERQRLSIGNEKARTIPIPELPAWQREHDPDPKAVSRPKVTPNGYLSGLVAKRACENAGKRLCRRDEWMKACGGEAKRRFPYGDRYEQGACNIFRALHPGTVLHNNPSIGHLDPRMNLIKEKDFDPLLRLTGATSRCRSEWGDEAAYDMNGNLDEWIEDEHGRFVGGFFSRARKDGCEASISAHPNSYFDYSTGARCCWSPDDGDASSPP